MEAYAIAIAIQIGIYALLTLGLNLHYGYTGLINFGHVAFYCIGAYASALIAGLGLGMPAGMVVAMVAASLASLVIGALTLRLRAEFLAIVTLGFGETVRLIALNETWLTHGTAGLPVIQPFMNWGSPTAHDFAYLMLVLAACVAVVLVIRRIVASPFGRLTRAIRDSEQSLRALGKAPSVTQMKVLMIGAAMGGLAGALQAHYIGFISPDQFTSDVTFLCWMAMIIGGTGRVAGSIVGAAILFGLFEGSRFLNGVLPGVSDVQIAYGRMALIGLLLVLFTRYRPQGLIPERGRHVTG